MKKNILFISCDEAKVICDKSQYGEATLLEKIKLYLRLSYCNITRSYSKRNANLTKTIESAHLQCLQTTEKQKLKHIIKQELGQNH